MSELRPGDLIRAGMLYEGSDFAEWRTRTDTILRLNDLDQHSSARATRIDPTYIDSTKHANVTAIICMLVSSTILERIPSPDRTVSPRLWKQLEVLSQPFRFLDLPPELRDIVYGLECNRGHEGIWQSVRNCRVPALTKASSSVRLEARRVFFTNKKFYVNHTVVHGLSDKRPWDVKFRRVVREWAERMADSDKKFLRYFQILGAGNDRTINLRLTRAAGLSIDYFDEDDRLNKSGHQVPSVTAQKALQDYVEKINADAKMLDLEGGNIILLALISKPELWEEDAFEWEEADIPGEEKAAEDNNDEDEE